MICWRSLWERSLLFSRSVLCVYLSLLRILLSFFYYAIFYPQGVYRVYVSMYVAAC